MKTDSSSKTPFDVKKIRQDFPIFNQRIHGRSLVYLDNAATSQKPNAVIDAIDKYYAADNANVHRGVHTLSTRATRAMEGSREKIRRFIGAKAIEEIVFVRGATEAINLVAQTWGRIHVSAGDEILVSAMEHHSNIVPWQMLCEEKRAKLKVIPIDRTGALDDAAYESLLTPKTKLVAIGHISNALGTINPIDRFTQKAHAVGAKVLIDGAQAAPHTAIDVGKLGCDFYCLSSHKMFGPTGIGTLYGKQALLEAMPPYQGGGEMITSVTFEKTTYNALPHKFEAGTPNIAGAIGMGVAIDYLNQIGMDAIAEHEESLLEYGTERLLTLPEVELIGTARNKASILSFTLKDIHPHDVGTILDQEGIAVRTGHHCAQPVMDFFEVPATTRASLAFYNTKEELDLLASGLKKVIEVFK